MLPGLHFTLSSFIGLSTSVNYVRHSGAWRGNLCLLVSRDICEACCFDSICVFIWHSIATLYSNIYVIVKLFAHSWALHFSRAAPCPVQPPESNLVPWMLFRRSTTHFLLLFQKSIRIKRCKTQIIRTLIRKFAIKARTVKKIPRSSYLKLKQFYRHSRKKNTYKVTEKSISL